MSRPIRPALARALFDRASRVTRIAREARDPEYDRALDALTTSERCAAIEPDGTFGRVFEGAQDRAVAAARADGLRLLRARGSLRRPDREMRALVLALAHAGIDLPEIRDAYAAALRQLEGEARALAERFDRELRAIVLRPVGPTFQSSRAA